MSHIAIGPHGPIALTNAPDEVKAYAREVESLEAYAMAKAGLLRCGASECHEPLQLSQGAVIPPYFSHPPNSAGESCKELTGPAGEWHLYMQYSVFKHAFSQEWHMQNAVADIVVQRKGKKGNRFAVEIQHSPIARETVLRRHKAHRAAGLMGTTWIVDGRSLKRGTKIYTPWIIDLIKACIDTPDGHPCTVLIYKDRPGEGGGETVSIIDSADFGHDADGRFFAKAHVVKEENDGVLDTLRFPMEALTFLAQGPKRPAIAPASFSAFRGILDAIPNRRLKDAARVRAYAESFAQAA